MYHLQGDGNCFYRSFLFAYLETLLHHYLSDLDATREEAEAERQRFLQVVTHSKDQLVQLGYEEMAIETFYDLLVELLQDLFSYSEQSLLDLFQEDGQSDYYTWFMRLLTAGAIRGEASRFFPFLPDDVLGQANHGIFSKEMAHGMDDEEEIKRKVATYCRQEVEPMGRESEQVHIIALAEYLNVIVSIEYLDGR